MSPDEAKRFLAACAAETAERTTHEKRSDEWLSQLTALREIEVGGGGEEPTSDEIGAWLIASLQQWVVELEEHKAVKALLTKVASLRTEAKIASGLSILAVSWMRTARARIGFRRTILAASVHPSRPFYKKPVF
jgi:hypothetical protein